VKKNPQTPARLSRKFLQIELNLRPVLRPAITREKRSDNLQNSSKKKRHRRTAAEIERNWKCEIPNCNKSYGSEGALKMHMKLKHPGLKQSNAKVNQQQSLNRNVSMPINQMIPFGVPQYMINQVPPSKSSTASQGNGHTSFNSFPPYASSSFSSQYSAYSAPSQHNNAGSRKPPVGSVYPSSFDLSKTTSPIQMYKSSTVYDMDRDTNHSMSYVDSPLGGPYSSPEHQFGSYSNTLQHQTNHNGMRGSPDEYSHDSDSEDEKSNDGVYLPILMLKIGTWNKTSVFCGDLVACFSFKEKKFGWEIFAMGSLLQIEIQFDEVCGLGLELFSDGTAMVIVEISKPPIFASGCLQPHTPTLWARVPDFTGGQASTCRQHALHFSKAALSQPLERLLSEEPRLKELAKKGLAPNSPLYFTNSPMSIPPPLGGSGTQSHPDHSFPPSSLSSLLPPTRGISGISRALLDEDNDEEGNNDKTH